MRRRKTLFFFGCMTALAVTACSSRQTAPEERASTTGRTTQALTGGGNDDDTPEANVVVRVYAAAVNRGGSCTGTLITPTAVLTARHCIAGDTLFISGESRAGLGRSPNIQVGAVMASPSGRYVGMESVVHGETWPKQQDLPGQEPRVTPDTVGRDVAVIFLDPTNPVRDVKITRPTLNGPVYGGRDENGGWYDPTRSGATRIGMSGWSPFGGSVRRQAVYFSKIELHHYPDYPDSDDGMGPNGQIWQWNPEPVYLGPGDSGSPLFLLRADGTRDVFGVLSGDFGFSAREVADCGTTCETWSDITRGDLKQWLLLVMRDRHSDAWLQKHGRTRDDWQGELDYVGTACDQARDQDCDGWYDEHDYCPAFPNSDQRDDDKCRACPWDPAGQGDADNDGVCAVVNPKGYEKADNCPTVFNPNQRNCNERSERARGAKVLGDECDSVPCGAGNAELSDPAAGEYTSHTKTGDVIAGGLEYGRKAPMNRIRVITTAPHYEAGGSLGELPNVPVDSRFCQNQAGFIECASPANVDDAYLTSPAWSEGPTPATPWHRMSLRTETPSGGSSIVQTSRSARGDRGMWKFRDGAFLTEIWDYLADWNFWTQSGAQMIPGGDNRTCGMEQFSGKGTCLGGTVWTHADSVVGAVSGTPGFSGFVHGPGLANNYFEMAPDEAFFTGWAGIGEWHRKMRWENLWDPDPLLDWRRRAVEVIVHRPSDDRIFALEEGGTGREVTNRFSTSAIRKMGDSSIVWLNAVEPVTMTGRIASSVKSVALSLEGNRLADVAVLDGKVLRLDSELKGGVLKDQKTAPSSRMNHAVFFSRAAGGAFVVGGTTQAGKALGDAWFRPLSGDGWQRLPVSDDLGNVLAATYSFADSRLWVASVMGTKLRLRRMDVSKGKLEDVAAWPWSSDKASCAGEGTVQLGIDRDGGVLVLVYGKASNETTIARFAVSGGTVAFQGLAREAGKLEEPPVYDGSSYVLVRFTESGSLVRDHRDKFEFVNVKDMGSVLGK